jgi:hypothetical protein
MTETVTRTHRCPDGSTQEVEATWDHDAQAYVQAEECENCPVRFELFEG